ncbi:MAG: hypothetical protein AB1629_04300 [Candidatus Omnitrophota bacterium]
MRKIIWILLCALLLASCSQNLKLLLQINNEDKVLKRDLRLEERGFSLLLHDLKQDKLKLGTLKKDIIARYGHPILEFPLQTESAVEKLLYRYPTKYFDSEKVYLYFDNNNELTDWDILER